MAGNPTRATVETEFTSLESCHSASEGSDANLTLLAVKYFTRLTSLTKLSCSVSLLNTVPSYLHFQDINSTSEFTGADLFAVAILRLFSWCWYLEVEKVDL